MTAADPPVAAAQRAVAEFSASTSLYPRSLAVIAAREALASLRKLHQPREHVGYYERWTECRTCTAQSWPCDTAILIYPEHELTQEN